MNLLRMHPIPMIRHRIRTLPRRAVQTRQERLALHVARDPDAREIKPRRRKVHVGDDVAAHRAWLDARSADEEGHLEGFFVDEALVEPAVFTAVFSGGIKCEPMGASGMGGVHGGSQWGERVGARGNCVVRTRGRSPDPRYTLPRCSQRGLLSPNSPASVRRCRRSTWDDE